MLANVTDELTAEVFTAVAWTQGRPAAVTALEGGSESSGVACERGEAQRTLVCSVDERKRMVLVRVGHFLSLSGFKCTHILQQSPCVPRSLLRLSNLRF